jgi:hypothetical protein
MLIISRKFNIINRIPRKINITKCMKTTFADEDNNNKKYNNNFRNSYYNNKIIGLDRLLSKTSKLVSSDDIKSLVQSKWGYNVNIDIIDVNKSQYLEIKLEDKDNYEIVTSKLLDINMTDYIMRLIREYNVSDGPTIDRNVYISLSLNSFKN